MAVGGFAQLARHRRDAADDTHRIRESTPVGASSRLLNLLGIGPWTRAASWSVVEPPGCDPPGHPTWATSTTTTASADKRCYQARLRRVAPVHPLLEQLDLVF